MKNVLMWVLVIALIIAGIVEIYAIITADIPLWMKFALL